MARAGQFQAEIVQENIIAMISKRNPSTVYKPQLDFEGAIKLTLGKVRASYVMLSFLFYSHPVPSPPSQANTIIF